MKSPKHKIVRVEAQSLRVHPRAQRDLVQIKVKQLMAALDLDAIGVLHAVEYEIDGAAALWVIDGQTRLAALMGHGLGEWIVEVIVHIDVKDDARACELFLKLNHRSQVAAFDRFENEARAGHTDATGVIDLARRRGLKVDRDSRDGVLCCVNVLKKLWNLDSGKTLGRTLDTILAAWGRTASAVEGKLVEGLALVHKTYDGAVDYAALSKKLAKYQGGASALVGDAKGLRDHRKSTLPRCVAEIVIETYNRGRHSGQLDPL